MTELELYKFIVDNEIEYHWYDNNTKVVMFVDVLEIGEFNNLLGNGIMDEEGVECHMKHAYFSFNATEICDYFGIKPENVFVNKD